MARRGGTARSGRWMRLIVSAAAGLVTAFLTSSCGDECREGGTGPFDLFVCADGSPEAAPALGGACSEANVDFSDCILKDYGWFCSIETRQTGVCTIDTRANGQPVTFELVLVHKLLGPCADRSAKPVQCCEAPVTVGNCGPDVP